MTTRLLAIALLSTACSAAGQDADVHYDIVASESTHAPPVYDPDKFGTAPCGQSVNPDPELEDFVQAADVRWREATGCGITITPNGIPVVAWDYVFLDTDEQIVYDVNPGLDRNQVCGVTVSSFTQGALAIYISVSEPEHCNVSEVVAHELGHVWAPPGTHAEEGLMAAGDSKKRTNLLSESSLEWVCSRLECKWLNEEY